MEMGLAVPLTMSQIEAANRLHGELLQWKATDKALHALKERFPEFDMDASLLKVVAINQLYGTNVYAVVRMAEHVSEVMCQSGTMDDVELVDEIATLPDMKHTSFASKFAHFFIDEERFPIYDSYVVKMLAYHLGAQEFVRDAGNPYKAFAANFHQLKQAAGLQCTTRELDHYLWLAGMYRKWKAKPGAHIGNEVALLFGSHLDEIDADLKVLCGVQLGRTAQASQPSDIPKVVGRGRRKRPRPTSTQPPSLQSGAQKDQAGLYGK